MVIVIFNHYNNNFIVKSQHVCQNFGTAENLAIYILDKELKSLTWGL